MAITGNKGDWSEFYAMLKLLGDGIMYSADGELNKIEKYFYPILNVIREEEGLNLERESANSQIIVYENDVRVLEIPTSDFVAMYQFLYHKIVNAKDAAFPITEAEEFMRKIRCKRLKALSSDKKDIVIRIHDLRTGMDPTLGFSIKSMLGKDSTLFNYSEATNITYKIVGGISESQMEMVNSIEDQLLRMDKLYELGCDLEYAYYDSDVCLCNFQLVDSVFPQFVAELVRMYFYRESETTSVKDLVELLEQRNPFGLNENSVFYPHKMKQFLIYVALGMTAAKQWNGRYDANGGFIVVKNDGDVVCYHFYDRNDVEDYLYNNTRFDNPSRDRCGGWGAVFKGDDGNFYITLNFQIKSKNKKQRKTQRVRTPR